MGRPIPPVSRFPSGGGLPLTNAGSATTLDVSRPARRSLTLRPVGSPSRHATRLSRRLRRLCRLHRRSDSYRLERPSCRVGIAPTEDQHLPPARNRSDPAASPPGATPAGRNRSATIEKVQTIWITGVLK